MGKVSYPFINSIEGVKTFSRDLLTESWIQIINRFDRVGEELDFVQAEVDLSRLTQESVLTLTDHQICKILTN